MTLHRKIINQKKENLINLQCCSTMEKKPFERIRRKKRGRKIKSFHLICDYKKVVELRKISYMLWLHALYAIPASIQPWPFRSHLTDAFHFILVFFLFPCSFDLSLLSFFWCGAFWHSFNHKSRYLLHRQADR